MLGNLLGRMKIISPNIKSKEKTTYNNLPYILKVFYYRDRHNTGWLTICELDRILTPEEVLQEGLVKLRGSKTAFGIFHGHRGPAIYTYPEEPNWKAKRRKKKKIITRNGFTMYQYAEDEEDAKVRKELGLDAG